MIRSSLLGLVFALAQAAVVTAIPLPLLDIGLPLDPIADEDEAGSLADGKPLYSTNRLPPPRPPSIRRKLPKWTPPPEKKGSRLPSTYAKVKGSRVVEDDTSDSGSDSSSSVPSSGGGGEGESGDASSGSSSGDASSAASTGPGMDSDEVLQQDDPSPPTSQQQCSTICAQAVPRLQGTAARQSFWCSLKDPADKSPCAWIVLALRKRFEAWSAAALAQGGGGGSMTRESLAVTFGTISQATCHNLCFPDDT